MSISLINSVAAACDRSLPPEQAIPLRIKALLGELRQHCTNLDAIEDTLVGLQEREQLLVAAIIAGGRIHDDLAIVFEGTAASL